MPAIKKILGNRFARLILTIMAVVVVATLVIGIQRARQRRKAVQTAAAPTQPTAETAGATPGQTITTTAGGSPGTSVTYQVQGQQGGVAEISPEEASAKQQSGEALILDVREARLFEARGSIKGAVNIPLAELQRRRGELPAGKLIITYAYAGIPAEVEAAKVAAAQLAGEYRTAVLKGDTGAWISAGLPVELPKSYREKAKAEAERKDKRGEK